MLLLLAGIPGLSLVHASDDPTDTTGQVTTGPTAATDINLYYFVCIALFAAAIFAFIVYPWMGIFAGIVGVAIVGMIINSGWLITQTIYDQTTQQIVHYVVPLGLYVWVPIILILFNFVAPLTKLKG